MGTGNDSPSNITGFSKCAPIHEPTGPSPVIPTSKSVLSIIMSQLLKLSVARTESPNHPVLLETEVPIRRALEVNQVQGDSDTTTASVRTSG